MNPKEGSPDPLKPSQHKGTVKGVGSDLPSIGMEVWDWFTIYLQLSLIGKKKRIGIRKEREKL